MTMKPMFSADYLGRMAQQGHWGDEILSDYFAATVADNPDKLAISGRNSMTGEHTSLTYADLSRRTNAIARGLDRLGIGQGDVVAYQLPNWWEVAAIHLACLQIGAVSNPLMPIFRDRELKFMLELAESRVFIVPREFRGFDHHSMATRLKKELSSLEHVVTIGGTDDMAFETVLLPDVEKKDVAPVQSFPGVEASDIIELIYTSGTTGEPKGVMHSSQTLLTNVRAFADRLNLTSDDVLLMSSPMAHQTGFLYGVVLAVYLGATAYYQDVWDPDEAADLMEKGNATYSMASTPFLSDLSAVGEVRPDAFQSLRTYVAAGAPIPRSLVRDAVTNLGADILSGWGMTEIGAVTITPSTAPQEKVFETDGLPLDAVELKVVDAFGAAMPSGREGRILASTAGMFAGYLKRPEFYTVDEDGWFDTGDLGTLDSDGYVRITGRSKDIIIRGGENIPVVEVENLIYGHPNVQEVAIVAMPDPRLGERGCAFIVTGDGSPMTLDVIVKWLCDLDIAKNYLPEHVENMKELPKTPSGKVQKFQLREIASQFSEERQLS